MEGIGLKVVFATPTRDRPHPAYLESLEATVPAVRAAGFEDACVFEIGCPYISAARARMLGKALKDGFDYILFIDDDLSWTPDAMVRLLQTPGDVVGGTYRFKTDEEKYMGLIETDSIGIPFTRQDGSILTDRLPGGFLRLSWDCVQQFKQAHPELILDKEPNPSVDIFNHGAHEGLWWGEDYAFSRRWRRMNGELWLVPDMDITHHGKDKAYPGNFHKFLLKQPGGSEAT